jgi:lysylphosphatidylglycerol synthetase-like protein (DUF2156 family)
MSEDRLLDRVPFVKIIVVLVCAFGIAMGLCGLTAVAAMSRNHALTSVLGPLGVIEMIVMILSAPGLVLTVVTWVVLSIVDSVKRS